MDYVKKRELEKKELGNRFRNKAIVPNKEIGNEAYVIAEDLYELAEKRVDKILDTWGFSVGTPLYEKQFDIMMAKIRTTLRVKNF